MAIALNEHCVGLELVCPCYNGHNAVPGDLAAHADSLLAIFPLFPVQHMLAAVNIYGSPMYARTLAILCTMSSNSSSTYTPSFHLLSVAPGLQWLWQMRVMRT